jgi:hypothetical protein
MIPVSRLFPLELSSSAESRHSPSRAHCRLSSTSTMRQVSRSGAHQRCFPALTRTTKSKHMVSSSRCPAILDLAYPFLFGSSPPIHQCSARGYYHCVYLLHWRDQLLHLVDEVLRSKAPRRPKLPADFWQLTCLLQPLQRNAPI